MTQMTIQQQEPLIKRTNDFIKKYGVSKKWLAEKTGITAQKFSYFCNSRFALSASQHDRLVAFLDEYQRRMVGFNAVEN